MDTLKLEAFREIIASDPKLTEGINPIIFDECIAPASWTLPSHASLFTGMGQSEHNCHETKEIKSLDIERIRLTERTIADDMHRAGYTTYGISANPYISPVYGFDFDKYFEESYFTDVFGSVIEVSKELKPKISKYRNAYGADLTGMAKAVALEDPKLFLDIAISATMLTPVAAAKKAKAKLIDGWPIEKGGKRILERIRSMRFKRPFFLFVNLMEAHDPYIGKKGMDFNWATPFLKSQPSNETIERWKQLYRKASHRSIRYGIDIIRDLISRFGNDQIIVLTSDHGQAFNERGFIGHGTVLFDETIKVPLAVIIPKRFSREKQKGRQSLMNIRGFVNAAIKGDEDALRLLTKDKAEAEAFSIPANISNVKGLDRRKIRLFDRYTKRVFE